MLEHSFAGLSDNTTYCVSTSNLTGKYILDDWLIYSNKPTKKFGFVESVGKIKQHGQGTLMPVMGNVNLYISQSGWHSIDTTERGQPLFYALDLHGNVKWENNLDGTYAFDVIELSNKCILVLSLSYNSPEVSFLWKFDNDGHNIWKIQLNRTIIPPVVDKDGNIYIKQGANISKLNAYGLILWSIDLGSDGGSYWERIICNNYSNYYGFQCNHKHYIIEFDNDGSIINKHAMPDYTLNPVIDSYTNTLYFIMHGDTLTAFDTERKQIKHQVELKKYTCSTPVIYFDYVVICYEKQVNIYRKDLTLISTHRLKGIIKGTNITENGILQILVSDYQLWDSGKSDICYSRLYEMQA